MATTTPCVWPPSRNNCLLSLKRTYTEYFNAHQVSIYISCFLRACSPGDDNASYHTFIAVFQRNPPRGWRPFMGQSEPGLHLCLAHQYTPSFLLLLLWQGDGEATQSCHIVSLNGRTAAKSDAAFLNIKVSTNHEWHGEIAPFALSSSTGAGDCWRKPGLNKEKGVISCLE